MDLLFINIDIFNSDDDDEDYELMERRQYTIQSKPNNLQMWDEVEFFQRFRLKKHTVLELLHRIQEQLLIQWNISRSLTPMNQLLLTLRFYATGNFLRACGDFSGVIISTASRIVAKVSMTIASLSKSIIKMPQSNEEIVTSQCAFYEMLKFPRVIGCIDGTHIRIQSPGGEHGEVFRNRKGYFYLNTQVVCDHKMRIIDIVARWPGSVHDATIFQHSRLRRRFEEVAETRYNNAHIRTRNIVKRVFGVWKRRFPVLSLGMRVKMETMQDIIIAVAVLHNIAISKNEEEPAAYVDLPDEGIENDNTNQLAVQRGNNNVRQALIDQYFSRLED